jgi:UDP-N-acetylmuramyl pentapeptide phosphotransferase/UDP-N-acetylglucosamine-1-phosphate transferase
MVCAAYVLITFWQFRNACAISPGLGCYNVRDPLDLAILAAATAGACIGFLWWNAAPAKIFMGDTGSMLLGMLVAIATISGVGSNPFPPERGDVAVIALPVLVPLLVLAIPFLDVLLAIVRRTRKGLGIGHADKEHIFHRLMDIGHGHRQTVLLMYLWSGLVCGSALAIGVIDGFLVAGVIVGCALVLFLVTALPRLLERRRNGEANGKDGELPDPEPEEDQTLPRPTPVPGSAPAEPDTP